MSSSFKEVPVYVGRRGLYKDQPPLLLNTSKEGETLGWAELDHFYSHNNQLVKFPGWEKFTPTAVTGTVLFGTNFRKLSGTRYLVVGTPTKVYAYNSTTKVFDAFVDTFATPNDGTRWQAAAMGDKLYMTNFEKFYKLTDSSTFATLGGDASAPTSAKFIVNFANHLFCGYTLEGSTTYQQRVRWSDVGGPTVWAAASSNEAGSYDLDEDSSAITGLALIGPQRCAIYKSNKIYLATYEELPAVFSFQRISADVGCFYPYSLVTYQDVHYFAAQNGFYRFTGLGAPEPIDMGKVRDYFNSTVQSNTPHAVHGWAHPTLPLIYWVFVPASANTLNFTRALVFNTVTGEWAERSYFPHSALFTHIREGGLTIAELSGTIADLAGDILHLGGASGELLMLSGNSAGTVHLHGYQEAGDGTPIKGIAETGDISFGNLHQFKRANRSVIELATGTTGAIRFQTYTKNNQADEPVLVGDTDLPASLRSDYRTHAKLHRFRVSTNGWTAVTSFHTKVKGAGTR